MQHNNTVLDEAVALAGGEFDSPGVGVRSDQAVLPDGRSGTDQTDTSVQQVDESAVLIPAPVENAVLSALREKGMYKAPIGESRHKVSCPWAAEHPSPVGSAIYGEPGDDWPTGRFQCDSNYCRGRSIQDLLQYIGVEASAARMKSTIRVQAGEVYRVVDAADKLLAQSGEYYQRGGQIVTVVTTPDLSEVKVQEVSKPALISALSRITNWEKRDSKARGWVRIDPSERHVSALFGESEYQYLPKLNGLARHPYLYPDGSLMVAAGYDQRTGLIGLFDESEYAVPDAPVKEDTKSALRLLTGILEDFNLGTEHDLAAALSAILTGVIRPSLPHAPMFHVRAHMSWSGKSYLCELITAFATPKQSAPVTFSSRNEECEKQLLSELRRAPAVIEYDNLTGDLLAHPSLCTVLTSGLFTSRLLGGSNMVTVGTRTLFLSSGNNVGPVQDMARRCITINLDPQCEVPATRTYQNPDLVGEVLKDRGRYVTAVLTIVRAWVEAGRPHTPCKGLSSFGEWSDLCRQPLLWLGMADPINSVFEAMAEDPDRENLRRVLVEWAQRFRDTPTMIRKVMEEDRGTALWEALEDVSGEHGDINRRKLGNWIKRHTGRVVDGLKFVKATGMRSAVAWQVVSV